MLEKENNDPHSSVQNPVPSFFSNDKLVTVYTVLAILKTIKEDLSLEAMLEYLEKYLSAIETYNPRFKLAVKKALSLVDIEKIYKDMMLNEQRGQK